MKQIIRFTFLLILLLFIYSFSCQKTAKISENDNMSFKNKNDSLKDKSSEDSINSGDFKNWCKYDIKEIGTISIPPEMELQSGNYKKLADFYYEINGLQNSQLVFQQKGLNDGEKNSFNSYARVIFKTEIKKPGDFEKLKKEYNITKDELLELNETVRKQFEKEFKKQNMKITKWYPIQMVKIKDMYALLESYDRTINDAPEVFVRLYQFHNNDRIHKLTLSYRLNDEQKWKPLFEKILKSIVLLESE